MSPSLEWGINFTDAPVVAINSEYIVLENILDTKNEILILNYFLRLLFGLNIKIPTLQIKKLKFKIKVTNSRSFS